MEKAKSISLKLFALLLLILVPVLCLFGGCSSDSLSIVSIEKTNSTGLHDTYTITYNDGSTYDFVITNGKDGQDAQNVEIIEVYNTAVEQGYSGTFMEFVQDYLSVSVDNSQGINKALMSTVSVYCNFTATEPYYYQNEMGQWMVGIRDVAYQSAGSGVIYSLDKSTGSVYIITNYHVVYSADSNKTSKISDEIYVCLYGSENEDSKILATYVGGSMTYDIAVLQVSNNEFLKNSSAMQAVVADSNDVAVGSNAIAVGNPEALGISATEGIISVASEYITMTAVDEQTEVTFRVMRIDTAINSGNSGGGLYDNEGRLIGIVNAKVVATDISGIAYAIPSNLAVSIAKNIIDNASNQTDGVKKFNFDILLSTTNSHAVYDTQTQIASIVEDVVVDEVTADGYAESLGLLANDIIKSISINDTVITVDRMYKLVESTLDIRAGDSITITYMRDNIENEITFTALEDNFVTIL